MSRKILIIDDDDDDCELFVDAAVMVEADLECEKVYRADRAIELLNTSYRPDFIFLDLNMPLVDGKKCLAEIRKISALNTIPVIVYTTSKRQDDQMSTLELGANYFITKPSALQELCDEIAYVLGHQWYEPANN
jgi:DNA-binding response OmpR family regulator